MRISRGGKRTFYRVVWASKVAFMYRLCFVTTHFGNLRTVKNQSALQVGPIKSTHLENVFFHVGPIILRQHTLKNVFLKESL